MPPALIIFLRCLIAGVLLYLYLRWRSQHRIDGSDKGFFIGSGVLLAIHWTTYFMSIKLGGVAVGMLSLFTYPVITALVEPFIFKTKHSWSDIGSSLLILVGLALIVPEFSLDNKVAQGVALGVISAVIYSFRNLWNKKYIVKYSGSSIMCYQLLVSAVVLAPALWIYQVDMNPQTWGYMMILVIVTTAIAHTLFVKGLKFFTTSSVSIMSSLTPLYGVAWAIWFTDETLNKGIIAGGTIIIVAIIAQNIKHFKTSNG